MKRRNKQERLWEALRKKLPYVIEIHQDPVRLINRTTKELRPEIVEWCDEHVHGQWRWDARFVEHPDADPKRISAPNEICLIFFFESLSDATYFRLAHSC